MTGTMDDGTHLEAARNYSRRDLVAALIAVPFAGLGAAAAEGVTINPATSRGAPLTIYVAPGGSDAAPGLAPGRPWRSLAAVRARAPVGALVRLAPGRWRETLEITAEGLSIKPC